MDKFKSNTAFIIPVYNEEQVIFDVANNVLKGFDTVVCVNDGSRDGSRQQIMKTGAYLVDHPINMGQGAALQTGIEFARLFPQIEYFVMFDADGQHQVKDAVVMLEQISKGQQDIILGSRFLGQADGLRKGKKTILKLGVLFSNLMSGLKLTDTHNGLRVFNRHVAETMQITLSDMAHASEILEIIRKNGYRYKEVPVTIKYTEYSMSKGQSIINAINIGFDTVLGKISR